MAAPDRSAGPFFLTPALVGRPCAFAYFVVADPRM